MTNKNISTVDKKIKWDSLNNLSLNIDGDIFMKEIKKRVESQLNFIVKERCNEFITYMISLAMEKYINKTIPVFAEYVDGKLIPYDNDSILFKRLLRNCILEYLNEKSEVIELAIKKEQEEYIAAIIKSVVRQYKKDIQKELRVLYNNELQTIKDNSEKSIKDLYQRLYQLSEEVRIKVRNDTVVKVEEC